ncbi:MAG TPA: transcriptional regulator [Vineibacter sp.]|nr:transcriptional regulator [Vineibacter sp.]
MTITQIATAKDFGAVVFAERTRQRLTQRQLALAAGTGERFIVELENGKETARLGTALWVLATLGLRLSAADES